jgi:hypothetical protein
MRTVCDHRTREVEPRSGAAQLIASGVCAVSTFHSENAEFRGTRAENMGLETACVAAEVRPAKLKPDSQEEARPTGTGLPQH